MTYSTVVIRNIVTGNGMTFLTYVIPLYKN